MSTSIVSGDVILSDGTVLTEKMMNEIAERAEQGILPGTPGKFIIAPPGRPRLSDEELVTIAFKVPKSERDKIDQLASARGQKRSEFLREALQTALATAL